VAEEKPLAGIWRR